MKRVVVALVGCTASGKTAVGELLARGLDGEVVCADSRQVFRELDIGTGKPPASERAARPHHLFDSLSVAAYGPAAGDAPRATAGWYARAARAACAAVHARERVPVLVGGSGLYLRAAREGLAPSPEVDPAIRARLQGELAARGAAALHGRLAELDPAAARAIHTADAQRITRALEVIESTGHGLAWWRERPATAAVEGRWQAFLLAVPPEELRRRIERRTRWMFENGLIDETRTLVQHGLRPALAALRAIGYDEALALIAGEIERPAAEERTRLRTGQLAKRQRTWFRHQMRAERIEASGDSDEQLAARVIAHVRRAG
jgi:tRNA dimethylallyltransferase